MALLSNFWHLFTLSAPWLMLGLFIAGVINVYLPKDFLNKHLGSEGFFTTIKSALIGAPMPLCSCGVIPAALGLRRSGASKSATTAFLVSTPETGVDSISVSYVLLGPFMAIIRPIAAICSAIVAGLLVGKEEIGKQVVGQDEKGVELEKSCCASKKEVVQPKSSCCASKEKVEVKQSCCSQTKQEESSVLKKLKHALTFSCTKLLQDTAKWLLIGLAFAAIVQTYVPWNIYCLLVFKFTTGNLE